MAGNSPALRYPVEEPPEFGSAIEIAEGVLWFRLPLPMALDHVNIFALDDGDGWTLIDTGMNTRKTRDVWDVILRGPLAGKPVKRVIVTHHHPDHVGLAGWFQTVHGAELVTTRTAWLMARMLVLDEHPEPTTETQDFWRKAGMEAADLQTRLTERPFNFCDIVEPMPLGFQRIVEGDKITIGQRDWTVRMGNGHAPEHATFWSDDDSVVIGGDQLLPSISPNLGVYASEPMADPVADWLEACERLGEFARDEQLVLPGHKLPFKGLPFRMQQMIGNHHGALERLLVFLETPHTAVECFVVLFKRKIGNAEYGLALAEAIAHVNHLYHLDKVTRVMRDDGAWEWCRRGR